MKSANFFVQEQANELIFSNIVALEEDLIDLITSTDSLASQKAIQLIAGHPSWVNAQDKYGCPALCIALFMNKPDVAHCLIQEGANVNLPSQARKITPLMAAAKDDGLKGIANELIARGALVNTLNDNNSTALMVAAFNGQPAMVKLLLEKGADKTCVNLQGNTAQALATREGEKVLAGGTPESVIKAGMYYSVITQLKPAPEAKGEIAHSHKKQKMK